MRIGPEIVLALEERGELIKLTRSMLEPFVCCRTDSSSHLVARLRRMVLDRVALCQVFTMFKHRLESCQ